MSEKHMDSPTERNQRRLSDAASRLLSGNATVSSGKLTLEALADEAGVARTSLYRGNYRQIVAAFKADADALSSRSGSPDANVAEIDRLKKELKKANERRRKWKAAADRDRADLRRAASQIAHLSLQNDVMRRQLRHLAPIRNIEQHTETREH
jgi:hypothetical protein